MLQKYFKQFQQHHFRLVQQSIRIRWSSVDTNSNVAPSSVSDVGLEQAYIDEAIRLAPALATATPDLWKRSHEVFRNHGLPTVNFLRIVTGNPAVILRPQNRIIETLEIWRSCQFGEKLLHLLLTKYPELLDVNDDRRLRNHIAYLKTFATSNKNVWQLLMNSPDLLEQPEQRIEEKIQYLTQVMRIEIPEIVKSEALSKPLNDIRCRHEFLKRLGLFTPRPLKADPNEPTKNPRLYQITDTSDKAFATKICHVTLVEFESFKDLYIKELKRKAIDEDLSDDE